MEMVPQYSKEESTKANMGLWCKLGIRGDANDFLFSKLFQCRDSPENVTSKTVDISKYLDFGFYEKVRFKDNSGLSLSALVRWLGISHRTGRLMCYHILTQTGKVIPRSTVGE